MSDTSTETEVVDPGRAVPISVMYDHSKRVYMAMHAEAKLEVVEGEQLVFWTGHLTRLFERLHYSTPYYSAITQILKRMGCIKQIRRGGGNAPSVWELVKEPSEDLFANAEELRKPGGRPEDIINQRLRDMNERLVAVEKALGLI